MAIVQTVNFSMFCDMFTRMGRQGHFSYAAKQAIFNYLESYSDDNGEDFQMDVVGICCEYIESKAEEVNSDYLLGYEKQEDESEEDFQERLIEEVQEYLDRHTTTVMADNGTFVYAEF